MAQQNNDTPLDSFEEQLKSLRPISEGVDRDYLMYLAGQAASRVSSNSDQSISLDQKTTRRQQQVWFWPTMTVISTTLSLILGLYIIYQPVPEPKIVREYITIQQTNDQEDLVNASDKSSTNTQQRMVDSQKRVGPHSNVYSPWWSPVSLVIDSDQERFSYLRMRDLVLTVGTEILPIAQTSKRQLVPLPSEEQKPLSYGSSRLYQSIDIPEKLF